MRQRVLDDGFGVIGQLTHIIAERAAHTVNRQMAKAHALKYRGHRYVRKRAATLLPREHQCVGWSIGICSGRPEQFDGRDRKSVVSGKSVSVRVDLGGRRINKTKTEQQNNYIVTT